MQARQIERLDREQKVRAVDARTCRVRSGTGHRLRDSRNHFAQPIGPEVGHRGFEGPSCAEYVRARRAEQRGAMLPRIITKLVGWAVALFYDLERTGPSLPDGPVLVAANHPNSLVDPLVIFRTAGRATRPLAKAPLFEQPLVGTVLRGLGGLPGLPEAGRPGPHAPERSHLRRGHRCPHGRRRGTDLPGRAQSFRPSPCHRCAPERLVSPSWPRREASGASVSRSSRSV